MAKESPIEIDGMVPELLPDARFQNCRMQRRMLRRQ